MNAVRYLADQRQFFDGTDIDNQRRAGGKKRPGIAWFNGAGVIDAILFGIGGGFGINGRKRRLRIVRMVERVPIG